MRGFDDPDARTLSNGKSVFYQPDPKNPAGYLLPFHLDTKTTSAQAIPSTSHAFFVQHSAWHNGKMDNWLPAHRKADGDDRGPYQEEDDYGCNPLEFFKAYQDADVSSPLYQHGMTIGPADQFEQDTLRVAATVPLGLSAQPAGITVV